MEIARMEAYLREFNPVEEYNKQRYLETGLREEYNYAWDSVAGRSSVSLRKNEDSTFVITGLTDTFPEDRYFRPGQDIAILKHDRYAYPFAHKHSFFEICYVLEGSFEHHIEETCYTHGKGDIVFIPPHAKHALYVFDDDCLILNLVIKSSEFDHNFRSITEQENTISSFFYDCLYHNSDSESRMLVVHTDGDAYIRELFLRSLNESLVEAPYSQKITNHLVKLIFYELLRSFEGHIEQHTLLVCNDKMANILQYIHDNYATVTLDEVAQKYFFNKYYLSRLIKKKTGHDFTEIVRKRRLEVALQLIQNTSLSFYEISQAVGYVDTTYLFRIFKNQYQMSPKECRALSRQEREQGRQEP